MTVVARVLPRNWDGRRLLRFLAGLAMLALAITGPAVTAPAVTAPAAVTSPAVTAPAVSAPLGTADVTLAAAAPSVAVPPADEPRPATLVVPAALLVLGGVALRIRAQRAPPAV